MKKLRCHLLIMGVLSHAIKLYMQNPSQTNATVKMHHILQIRDMHGPQILLKAVNRGGMVGK